MNNSLLPLSPEYDEFLFAPVCKEANGMQLSVLSALARLNLDPWEEATRLAAMPKEDARRVLISTLGFVAGTSRSPSEAQMTAARLVRLLPDQSECATPTAQPIADVSAQRTNYWLALLFIAMAIAILSLHQAPAADPERSTSGAARGGENITPPV
jgi:hypothetical protein